MFSIFNFFITGTSPVSVGCKYNLSDRNVREPTNGPLDNLSFVSKNNFNSDAASSGHWSASK